jgi:Ca2+-binding RTX toxin-like protein
MNALQDSDVLLAYRGDDLLQGDDPSPADTATDGDDKLYANNGEDTLQGYGGSDLLRGGGRADFIDALELSANEGEDTVRGDGGRDLVSAEDGVKDTIDCGDNVDTAFVDEGLDVVTNCENVNPEVDSLSASKQSLLTSNPRE